MQTRAQGATLAYITRTFVKEPDFIAQARQKGEALRPGMQVSSYEGYLLSWITKLAGAKRVLEIGTFMGVSTLWLAEGAGEEGTITALEYAAEHVALARGHVAASPHAARVNIHHADAHRWLAERPLEPAYDLVFINAEKAAYADYLDAVIPRLHPRGMIIGDNTLLFGALAGTAPDAASAKAMASMLRFNEVLADAERFEGILLPTPEGLTVARLK